VRATRFWRLRGECADFASGVQVCACAAKIGKTIDPEKWLTKDALDELYAVERNGYRTGHYQLTRGGIGCYLSHYYLAKKLLEDTTTDAYLILEDDIKLLPTIYDKIINLLKIAPKDWDLILFYLFYYHGEDVDANFKRPYGFYGMQCYIINKSGAKKFVDETDNAKIDGQVDSYLSRMSQQKKLNLYVSTVFMIENNSTDTNIQMNLIENENSHDFRGYNV
jgi:GR25 family glycosyltransferase involved in LPS biosynthesis